MHNLEEVVDKLIGLERQKYNVLLKVLEITKNQHNVILDFDVDKLNELIESRQKEIDSLEALDKEYSLSVEEIKSKYNVKALDELEFSSTTKSFELESITEGIKKALKELESYENENHKILEEQKKEFGDKIKQINQGKKAEKMYQTKGYIQPVFYDKKTHY